MAQKQGYGSGKKMKLSTQLLLLILVFTLITCGYYVWRLFIKKPVYDALEPKEVTDISDDYAADIPAKSAKGGRPGNIKAIRACSVSKRYGLTDLVTDEKAADKALRGLGEELGIDFDRYEFKCFDHERNLHTDTYSFQQCYQSIPVLGCEIALAVNPNQTIRSITGIQAEFPEDAALGEAVNEKEAGDIINDYVQKEYRETAGEYRLVAEGLVWTVSDDIIDPVYRFRLADQEDRQSAFFHVSAKTGRVEEFGPLENAVMEHVNLLGQTGIKRVACDRISEDTVLLRDTNRNIEICNGEGAGDDPVSVNLDNDFDKKAEDQSRGKDKASDDKASGDEDPVKKSAVDALWTVQRAWQFFAGTQKRRGIDGRRAPVRVYVGEDDREVPKGMAARQISEDNSCILVSYTAMASSGALDLMGHEYTHGLINAAWNRKAGVHYPDENMAVAEGLADVFGEAIEDYYDGGRFNGSCDWVAGTPGKPGRDAKKASEGQAASYEEYLDNSKEADPYQGAYLVSHAAYLMTRGIDGTQDKKIGPEDVSRLFYNAMWMMTGFSDFKDLRFCLEVTADVYEKTGKLTERQMACVIEALDAVGLPKSYDCAVGEGGSLLVCDSSGQPSAAGSVNVFDLYDPKNPVFSDELKGNPLRTHLVPGLYLVRIMDSDGAVRDEKTMIVGRGEAYDQEARILSGKDDPKKIVRVKIKAEARAAVWQGSSLLSAAAVMDTSAKDISSSSVAVSTSGETPASGGADDSAVFLLGQDKDYEILIDEIRSDEVSIDLEYCDPDRPDRMIQKSFESVPSHNGTMVLRLKGGTFAASLWNDLDGDGRADRVYETSNREKDGQARPAGRPGSGFMMRTASLLAGLFILYHLLRALTVFLTERKKKKTGPVCENCGMMNVRGVRACRNCGKLLPPPPEGYTPEFVRERETSSGIVRKLALCVFLLLLAGIAARFFRGPRMQARAELRQGHPVTAACILANIRED